MKNRVSLLAGLCVALFGSYVYAQFGAKPSVLSTIKVRDDLFVGYNDVLGGLEELYCIVNEGQQRNQGFSREKIRDVSMPPCPLQSTPFLSQTP